MNTHCDGIDKLFGCTNGWEGRNLTILLYLLTPRRNVWVICHIRIVLFIAVLNHGAHELSDCIPNFGDVLPIGVIFEPWTREFVLRKATRFKLLRNVVCDEVKVCESVLDEVLGLRST